MSRYELPRADAKEKYIRKNITMTEEATSKKDVKVSFFPELSVDEYGRLQGLPKLKMDIAINTYGVLTKSFGDSHFANYDFIRLSDEKQNALVKVAQRAFNVLRNTLTSITENTKHALVISKYDQFIPAQFYYNIPPILEILWPELSMGGVRGIEYMWEYNEVPSLLHLVVFFYFYT